MHQNFFLCDVPIDGVLLSGPILCLYVGHNEVHTLMVCLFCFALLVCSTLTERRVRRQKLVQHTKNYDSILQNLREAKNCGMCYGILPVVAVAAEANHGHGGSMWSDNLCVITLTTLSCYLLVMCWLNCDDTSWTMLLILSLADLGLMFYGICTSHDTAMLALFTYCLVQIACMTGLWLCWTWASGCFTLGEGMIVSQLFTLFLYRVLKAFVSDSNYPSYQESWTSIEEHWSSQAHGFAAVGFIGLTVILSMLLLYQWYFSHRPGSCIFYSVVLSISIFGILPSLYTHLELNPFLWLLLYITQSPRRLSLFISWVVLSVIAACVVCGTNFSPSSTVTRKCFHIVVVAVYVPGLLLDPCFLTLASVVALVVLVLLETMRVLHIPPLGSVVDGLFKAFCDEKDKGPVIVSHIYLLVGLSLPLWMTYSSSTLHAHARDISLYSGVISLGVGDTAASVGGTLFGRHKWPESNKSLEGTGIAVLSQVLAVLCLYYLGMGIPHSMLTVIVIVILTSVLEGVTAQIDNLILPLFMYTLFTAVRARS